MTVGHSLHGAPLMARAGTLWAAPAARRQDSPQRQDRLCRHGPVWDRVHQAHPSESWRVDQGGQMEATDVVGHLPSRQDQTW